MMVTSFIIGMKLYRYHKRFGIACQTISDWCIISRYLISYRSGSFLGRGLVLGVFVLMNMDYALLNYELGMFLFVIWLVCIYKKEDGYDG